MNVTQFSTAMCVASGSTKWGCYRRNYRTIERGITTSLLAITKSCRRSDIPSTCSTYSSLGSSVRGSDALAWRVKLDAIRINWLNLCVFREALPFVHKGFTRVCSERKLENVDSSLIPSSSAIQML